MRAEIFEPLGMASSSFTADAIEAAADTTSGYRWTAEGTVEVPFTPIFPYGFGAAGAINSTVEDLAHWVRLHLADGSFEGRRIVSAENLAATKVPRVGISDTLAYAMGWVVQSTPNGRIVWHNGGTTAYGAFIGTAPDKDVGVIVLTNETNVGFPDAIGEWTLDRLLGNPEVDHVAAKLKAARDRAAADAAVFARPASPSPAPPLAPLAGDFVNPAFGKVGLREDGGGLMVELAGTGARLRLDPWDGGVFTASLVAEGRFAAIAANIGPGPLGFVQYQIDAAGKLDQFRFSMADGQAYEFRRGIARGAQTTASAAGASSASARSTSSGPAPRRCALSDSARRHARAPGRPWKAPSMCRVIWCSPVPRARSSSMYGSIARTAASAATSGPGPPKITRSAAPRSAGA